MSRSLKGRLDRLERSQAAVPTIVWRDEDEELDLYEEWYRGGVFDAEPDFAGALEFARDAVARGRASADPPWDPPDDYDPTHRDFRPVLRLQNWRRSSRFPDVKTAFEWLAEFVERVVHAIPPVTEVEYHELAAWFETNAARLDRLADGQPNGLLDVGVIDDRGHRTKVRGWMVRYDLRHGPRAEDAGRTAETIRRLRDAYGESPCEI